jgi:5-methylcytosine-specific restriction endonuclease McrA
MSRAAGCFPCIFGMIARGELHLTGVHQLAAYLTNENHREILQRARHKSMREIERLIAEISPKADVPASIRALPMRRTQRRSRTTPLSPRRYKLQVTIGQEARDKLAELQNLLSHQIPDGDTAAILERALDALLAETKKKKAALTDKPRSKRMQSTNKGRAIPASVRREVFERDEGRCAFADAEGRRCQSSWQVEFHHRLPYARGGPRSTDNIELRCRAHNQYEAELDYGAGFMAARRLGEPEKSFTAPP